MNKLRPLLLSTLCCACRNDLAHHCLDEHPFEDTDAYFYRFVSHEPPDYLLQRCTPASLSSTLRPVDGAAVHEVPVLLHCRVPFARPSPALLPVFLPSQGCGTRHTQLRHLSPSNTRRIAHPERACKQLRVFGCKRGRQPGCIVSVGSKAPGQLWQRAALVCGVVEAARQVDIHLFCALMLHQLSVFSFPYRLIIKWLQVYRAVFRAALEQ